MRGLAKPKAGTFRYQFTGYAIVGMANTIITFTAYQILYLWFSYWLAYTLVFIGSFIFTLTANTYFVFHSRITARSTLSLLIVYVINYLISLAIIGALIEWFR